MISQSKVSEWTPVLYWTSVGGHWDVCCTCTNVLFGLNVLINQKEIEYFYFAIHKLVSTEDHPFSGHTNITSL